MSLKISQMAAAAALVGTEQLELSQLSTTVTITAATISAAAADNSCNDLFFFFVAAGFALNDTVQVTGFTGSAANNIYSATVTAVTAGKLTIGGTDGDVIVDDAAGESVTITKWNSRRVAKSDLVGESSRPSNAQTGTTYALLSTDRGKHVTLSNAASIAVSIAQAGTTGFADGYFTYIEVIGVGAATITPTTSTINGAATLVLDSGMSAILFSDGTNYRAMVFDAAGVSVNAQTGTTYTFLSGDRGKLVTQTNAAAIADTLPQATGAFGAGWFTWVQNRGAGTVTITPTTSTIDGAATLALTTGQGALIVSDGTNYYTMRGVGSASSGGSGTKTYAVLTPMTSQPPAANFATLDTRNSIAVLEYNAAAEEATFWVWVVPEAASLGSGLIVKLHWMGDTATSGDVKWGAAFERMNTDVDTDSYDTETTGTSTTNATSGIITVTSITCTTIDGVTAGDAVRIKIARKSADGADTMSGDAQLVAVEIRSAA